MLLTAYFWTGTGLNRFPLLFTVLVIVASLGFTSRADSAASPRNDARLAHKDVSDATLRQAWKALPMEERGEIAAWYRAECDRRKTFSRQLERHVFHSLKKARGDWGSVRPPAVYDAAKHAPAQPILRKLLGPDNPKVQAERKRMGLSSIQPAPAWTYDWTRGLVQQSKDPFAPDHLFELALAGRSPEQDLAVALIEQFLDVGALRDLHKAFGPTYASRTGTAYGGISLYDAWGSGVNIEMPDVECLAILHEVDNDWKSFTAPVPGNRQAPLYKRIGEMFHQIRRERSLAQALALSYFDVEPELEETYASAKDRLQLFWAKHDSALDVSKGTLPASEEWDSWWEGLGKLQDDEGLMERAAERRMAVRTEGAQLRGIMIWVMREWGALENK